MKPKFLSSVVSSFTLCLFGASFAQAVETTWTGATNGVWDLNSNWSTSLVPTSIDDVIVLGPLNSAGALNLKFTTATSPTANSITFNNTAATAVTTVATANVNLTVGAGGITTGTGAVTIGANSATTGVNMILGASQTWNVGTGGMTVTNSITGSGFGITKTGSGTLTYNTGGAGNFNGGLTLNGGTMTLDFVNMGTPTDIVNSANTLNFGGGTLRLKGKSTGTTSQTFGDVTVSGGGGQILGDKNGGTALNITLKTLTATSAGGSLLVGAGGTAANIPVITTTTNKDATGIYGGRTVYFDGTANTGYHWATTVSGASPYILSAYSGYTAMPLSVGSTSTNYSTSAGGALAGNLDVNTLKIVGSATALAVDGNLLTLNSGGLLSTGTVAQTISATGTGTRITAGNGSGSYDVIVHQFNSGGLIVGATVGDNGGTAVNFVKTGSGNLALAGAHTYTGDTYVNGGTLTVGALPTNNASTAGSLGGGTYSGKIFIAGGATFSLRNNAAQTLSGNISGDGNFSKIGPGVAVLSGTNTYTGTTTLAPQGASAGGGTLSVASFNSVFTNAALGTVHSASSSLGAPTTVANGTITIGASIASTAILKYTGTGETTDRVLNFNFNSGSGHSLDASGSGLLKFTSSFTGSGSAGTLTLTGTGAGEIAGSIPNFYANMPLAKTSTGTWTLGGSNAYTGTTSITGGTLSFAKTTSLYNNTQASWTPTNISVNSGTILALGVGNSASGYFDSTALDTFRDSTHMGLSTATTGFKTGAILGFDTTNATAGTFTYSSTIGNFGTALTNGIAKVGVGTLVLDGPNNYTGTSAVNQGTLQINAGGTLGATSATLSMGNGVAGTLSPVGNLTLNTDATVGAFTVKSNTATTVGANVGVLNIAATKTLATGAMTVGLASGATLGLDTRTALGTSGGGTLTVTGALNMSQAGSGTASVGAYSVLNLSGLANFNNNNSAGTTSLGSAVNSFATLTLASTSNLINATTLSIASTGGNNSSLGQSVLNLGAGTNTIQANTITIGAGKGQGTLQFAVSTGSVNISGTGGVGTAAITVGNATAGTYSPGSRTNNLLLAGHLAAVNAGAVIVGQNAGNTGGKPTSNITFDTGTFNATSVTLASNTSGTSATAPTATFTVGGPTADSTATGVLTVAGNFLLANNVNSNVAATGTVTGSLIINGGTVNIGSSAANGIFDTSTSTTGSSSTTLTLAGGTLNLNGGAIGGSGVSGNRAITNLNFQSGTLKDVLSINGNGGLTKTTAGTLVIEGTNSYTGATLVSEGKLIVNGSINSTTTVTVDSGATLGGSGSVGGAITINGTLSPGTSPGQLSVANSLGLGNGSLTLMELGGATLGTGYDNISLNAAGALVYGGGLNVVNFGGYDMSLTSLTYDLFSLNGVVPTGDFASVTVNSVSLTNNLGVWTGSGSGVTYEFNQSIGDLTIAIPEPSTALLTALGALALLRRRR